MLMHDVVAVDWLELEALRLFSINFGLTAQAYYMFICHDFPTSSREKRSSSRCRDRHISFGKVHSTVRPFIKGALIQFKGYLLVKMDMLSKYRPFFRTEQPVICRSMYILSCIHHSRTFLRPGPNSSISFTSWWADVGRCNLVGVWWWVTWSTI
jgi:hypothetical protein